MAQAFSASTSAFIHISINQFTTFQYIELCWYSIIQSIPTCPCSLSYRKTHLFENRSSFFCNYDGLKQHAIGQNPFHYSLVLLRKRFHIYGIFPSEIRIRHMFTLHVTRVPAWYWLASKDLLVRECRHITIDIFFPHTICISWLYFKSCMT